MNILEEKKHGQDQPRTLSQKFSGWGGGGKFRQRVFEVLERKKIQELPRTMSQNSVGEEVENSGRVFERLEKKIQGAPADNPIQGGGGGKQAACF